MWVVLYIVVPFWAPFFYKGVWCWLLGVTDSRGQLRIGYEVLSSGKLEFEGPLTCSSFDQEV